MGRLKEIHQSTQQQRHAYLDALDWRDNPFTGQPTPDEYVLPTSTDIEDISAYVTDYTGPIFVHSSLSGIGKTTLLKMIMEEFDDFQAVFVGEHELTSYSMASIIADRVGIQKASSTKQTEQRLVEADFDSPVLLGIDEFGLNKPGTIHTLQHLNDEGDFRIILTGMTEQWEALDSRSEYRAFRRRRAHELELKPLSSEQGTELYQRRVASVHRDDIAHENYEAVPLDPFDEDTLEIIHERSQGVPGVMLAAVNELLNMGSYLYDQSGETQIDPTYVTGIDYADPKADPQADETEES